MERKKRREKPAGRSQLPDIARLPEECWSIMDEYLTAAMAHAKTAEASARAGAKIDETGCYAANAAYWRHAHGGYRWLRGMIRQQVQYERARRDSASQPAQS